MDKVGQSGGLALLWIEEFRVQVLSSSRFYIDAIVDSREGQPWRFTGFYGHPGLEQRHNSWELLRRLKRVNSLLWQVRGDINEILCNSEKQSGSPRYWDIMARFQEALVDCGLRDIGYIGYKYTWSNRREKSNLVKARLDRFLTSYDWKQ